MTADEGLRPVEGQAWIGFLRVHAMIVRVLDQALQEQQSLSLAEFEALLYLSTAADYRRRLSDLAAHSLLSLSGMSRLADRLEGAGLIKRASSPEDRRGTYIALTDQGIARLRSADQAHQRDIHTQFTQHFSDDELRQMARFWERLRSGATNLIKPFAS